MRQWSIIVAACRAKSRRTPLRVFAGLAALVAVGFAFVPSVLADPPGTVGSPAPSQMDFAVCSSDGNCPGLVWSSGEFQITGGSNGSFTCDQPVSSGQLGSFTTAQAPTVLEIHLEQGGYCGGPGLGAEANDLSVSVTDLGPSGSATSTFTGSSGPSSADIQFPGSITFTVGDCYQVTVNFHGGTTIDQLGFSDTTTPSSATGEMCITQPPLAQCSQLTTPLGSASQTITGTYNGNVEVKSGQLVWLNGGTINGNVTVDPGGQFAATGVPSSSGGSPTLASINGNVTDNGSVEAVLTTIAKNVTANNGGLSLGYGTSVGGDVQPTGSGPLCLGTVGPGQTAAQTGAGQSGPVVVNGIRQNSSVAGNVQVQHLTGTAPAIFCFVSIRGDLQWQNNAARVDISDPNDGCGGPSVGGNLTVQNNTGNAYIQVFPNFVQGNVTVTNNTGGGALLTTATYGDYGNSNDQDPFPTGGSCTLQNNTPAFTGLFGNIVPPGKQDNCNQ